MSKNVGVSSKIELLPHNQELYDKVVEQIEKGEKSIFYSQATGLGKSFIFMKLVEDYFQEKKIMYIVPKIAIWENIIRYPEFKTLNTQIDMFTYQSFNIYDRELVNEYDAVFIDECHHMLSDIQGSNIMTYCSDMNSEGKYTFGFTATPYYQDKYVDEECFDVSCYGYDVYEAIANGLLPKIKLALADINLDEVPLDLKVKYSITGTKNLLDKLIQEHSEIHRWIAYFPNKKELELRAHELSMLFPHYKILKTYFGYEYEDYAIDEFNNYNGNIILLSVNKLLEGVHLKDVQGVLLYRNVTEFSTYMQMYGRLCDINAKVTPLFLDVSNALLSFKGINETKSSRFIGERKRYRHKDLFDITAQDYWTVELADIMSPMLYHKSDEFIYNVIDLYKEGKTLHQVCKKLNVSKEVIYCVLKKYAPEYIIDDTYYSDELSLIRTLLEQGLSYKEITNEVNNYHKDNLTGITRTFRGIYEVIYKKIGITNSLAKPFDTHEIKVLELHGKEMSLSELAELLPGRSRESIRYKLKYMGIDYKKSFTTIYNNISEDKLRELHKRYLKGARLKVLAAEIKVCGGSLRNAWNSLGLTTSLNLSQILLLPDNYNILKSCWHRSDRKEIIEKEFPEVSYSTICSLASSIGLVGSKKSISDNEKNIIKDCILKHISIVDTCNILNNLEENKSRNIIRKPGSIRFVKDKIYQEMLSEGYSEEQLSSKYTDEEDSIILKYKSSEISLKEATNLINNLQSNKDRYLVRTSAAVISRKKILI